jgi:epoxyqueuosine reductase
VKALALAVGFDRVGIAAARPDSQTEFLREWVDRGYAGRMGYLTDRVEERVDPRRVLAGAESVIAVSLVYDPQGELAEPPGPGSTRVARYAAGDDYHEVLFDRLEALQAGLEALVGAELRSRAYVDTGPVLERVFAARAGLGWLGKNTCLIDRELGSYMFLGVLLTDLALDVDAPEADHCGSCTACLDACPTDAFEAARVLDARRCIAYTTIEDPGPIPAHLREAHGDRMFGCDICQEVCPWNRPNQGGVLPDVLGLRERLAPRQEWLAPALEWVLGLDPAAWRKATRRSALRRAKYRGLMRNALVAAGNSGARELEPRIRAFAESDDAMLAEHARWALARLAGD